MAGAPPPEPPRKRSVTIAGHETSIALEPLFWKALEEAAAEDRLPLNALIARIDARRLEQSPPANLASAIRQWLFVRASAGEAVSGPGESAPGSQSGRASAH